MQKLGSLQLDRSNERPLVALVRTPTTLILNKGSADGINYGQRFLIYSMGDEVTDPKTNQSLGRLEVVKGTGKIIHLQEKMATLESDMKTNPLKTIRKASPVGSISAMISGFSGETIEEQLPTQAIPFTDPERGDIAKPI